MLITSGQACELLGRVHLLGRNQALRVLQSGLAGERTRLGAGYGYDSDALDALLARPRCGTEALDQHRPFIARIGRNRPFDARAAWDEQREQLADGWYLPRLAVEQMRGHHPVPFLATLGAWVVFGGRISGYEKTRMEPVDVRPQNRSHGPTRFTLTPPGDWFPEFEGTWLPIENGATWTHWGALNSTPSRADPFRADYHERLDDERFMKRLYSTARHRSLARRLADPPTDS
ncbi:hypothetical protein [Nocardioides sp. NPDC004968]|uniref:hypothetical protein n=1 Tax=Nocardioides sp. NPDC004968 TaxID=3155894 RepID=UPI0033BF4F05